MFNEHKVSVLRNENAQGGDAETLEKQPIIISAALGRVLVLPQRIHIAISLSSSAELKPQQMADVNYLMKHSLLQRSSQCDD